MSPLPVVEDLEVLEQLGASALIVDSVLVYLLVVLLAVAHVPVVAWSLIGGLRRWQPG